MRSPLPPLLTLFYISDPEYRQISRGSLPTSPARAPGLVRRCSSIDTTIGQCDDLALANDTRSFSAVPLGHHVLWRDIRSEPLDKDPLFTVPPSCARRPIT